MEDFLDTVSQTRLQDEYNKDIKECNIFVILFYTKVGKYTKEEFETAYSKFKKKNKPFIFTYFKDAEVDISKANKKDLMSLRSFQKMIDQLGHFYTVYKNIEGLREHFSNQLDKLIASGFIEFKVQKLEIKKDDGTTVSNSKNVNTGSISSKGAVTFGENN